MSSIKRDVKRKAPPRPEDRVFLEIQRTGVSVPLKMFGLLSILISFSRLLVATIERARRRKQDGVNHGSIRGSWPIAISGYPRGHSV